MNKNINNTEELRDLYGFPQGRAKDKLLNVLEKHAIHFVETSPFVVMSTFDKNGNVDTSPRGGRPGFVQVASELELIIPDSKGNNRVDSMSNILDTGRVGLLFLIPGVDETLRINGGASISSDTEILKTFKDEKNPPKTVIKVSVEEVFLHCAKALMRSKLWSQESQIERSTFPTIGRMLNDQLDIAGEVESHADMVERYKQDL